MSKALFGVLVAMLMLALAGCGSSSDSVKADEEDAGPRTEPSLPVSLSALLGKPRSELAELATEWTGRIRTHDKAFREGTLTFALLPELRFPACIPVLREATYSEAEGFSRPPYSAVGKADVDLALHFARYGDGEAARKLAGDAGSEVAARIDAAKLGRNYPVEWTRLVGLMLHDAQFRLAAGDMEGALELMDLHRQLRKVLDPRAAEGPLGAALLPVGHKALAAPAVRRKDEDLAAQIDGSLKHWGGAPSPLAVVPLGRPRAVVAGALGARTEQTTIVAANTARAVDFLSLPVAVEGVQAVVAFFDASDSLVEVLVTYREGLVQNYPEAGHVVQPLEDAEVPAPAGTVPSLRRRAYQTGNTTGEVVLAPLSHAAGGLVRFRLSPAPATGPLQRDFGLVHLDRGYEPNRLQVAPEQPGEVARTKRPDRLARLGGPLAKSQPGSVAVFREPGAAGVSRLVASYVWTPGASSLNQLALPLWQSAGPAEVVTSDGDHGGSLEFVWTSGPTRWVLRLPNSLDAPVEFVAENVRSADTTAGGAVAFDEAERKARLASGKPLTRLPRSLERVQLGQSREEAARSLPTGKGFLVHEVAGGLSLTNLEAAGPGATQVARHLLVRFEAGRAAEVRVRYERGPAAKAGWSQGVLAGWKKLNGAATEETAGVGVWSEFGPSGPSPVRLAWLDDRTRMTIEPQGATIEVTLRDCPPAHAAGVPLPPLEFLPRGPANCRLGDSRSQLLRGWKVDKPVTTADVDLVLYPPKTSPHDALMIWFEGDRVVRVVARNRGPTRESLKPEQQSEALSQAWVRDIPGWPSRQFAEEDPAGPGLGWFDEQTRVRLYWQGSEGASRLYTEWKAAAATERAASSRP